MTPIINRNERDRLTRLQHQNPFCAIAHREGPSSPSRHRALSRFGNCGLCGRSGAWRLYRAIYL